MELPAHPDNDKGSSHQRQTTTRGRGTAFVIAVVIALFVAMILLHLTGVVGPGAH